MLVLQPLLKHLCLYAGARAEQLPAAHVGVCFRQEGHSCRHAATPLAAGLLATDSSIGPQQGRRP